MQHKGSFGNTENKSYRITNSVWSNLFMRDNAKSAIFRALVHQSRACFQFQVIAQ